MEITSKKYGSAVVVNIEGRIDTNTAMEFGEKVNDLLDNITDLVEELADSNISLYCMRITYETEKMTITFTTVENQKSNEHKNITTINLGECEKLLRKHYNISDDKTL